MRFGDDNLSKFTCNATSFPYLSFPERKNITPIQIHDYKFYETLILLKNVHSLRTFKNKNMQIYC